MVKNTLTAGEVTAVTEAWTKVMATNVGDTSSGLLLEYIFNIICNLKL